MTITGIFIKVAIKIEYKGTRYSGWQIQPNAETVQNVLETAFQQILQQKTSIKACSRTDAGVHAKGQVATLAIPEQTNLNKLYKSINSILPSDIAVTDLVEVSEAFNIRKAPIAKRYIYQVINAPIARVFESDTSLWKKSQLDLKKASQGMDLFLGTHDFSAFRGKGCQQPNPVKTIQQVDVTQTETNGYSVIRFCFQGSGFLKNMIRIMVGTLLDVAQGKLDVDSISAALESGDRRKAGMTAPPQGLVLEEVYLEPDPFQTRTMRTWQLG